MRTKAVVLGAAVLAAGALTSMAQQNVYSLNVVGYINLSLPSGYSLIANQLNGTNNVLNTVFGTSFAQDGEQVLKWNASSQGFNQPDTFYTAATAGTAGWYDSSFNPSTTTVSPGEGVFFYNAGSTATVTLVGSVPQTTNTTSLVPGYTFASISAPVAVDLTTNSTLALPSFAQDGPSYATFTTGVGYSQPITFYTAATAGTAGWYDSSFNPAHIIPAVGQGFLIYNDGAAVPWTTSFTVQ
jgi:plastocyanin